MLAYLTLVLLAVTALLGLTHFFVTHFTRRRRDGEPAVVAGSWLFGSAKDFKSHAVNLLHRSHKKYGDVFTLRLLNQYLTIVMDPHSYEAVTKERNFDFDPIQKQVNWNVFSFVLREPRKMIKDTGRTVRGSYLERGIQGFIEHLDSSYENMLPDSANWTQQGLRVFTAKTMFDALFKTIFGSDNHDHFNSQRVFQNFEKFHQYFNYFWLGLPKKWFPPAMRALEELLSQPTAEDLLGRCDSSDYIKTAVKYMQAQGQTDFDIKGHNLVYLHVNYNTFRLAFWVLDSLLENPEAMKALQEELQDAVEQRVDDGGIATFSQVDIESLKVLDSVVQETARISSGVFIVRYVKEDTNFTTDRGEEYLIRGGDRVAIYPPAFHKDPEIFEDPEVFKYDRFVDAKFYKRGKEVKQPVIAFGALCPGKRYALLQLKWYILSVLSTFQFQLCPGSHAEFDFSYYGHEILPPKQDINISVRRRDTRSRLQFSRV